MPLKNVREIPEEPVDAGEGAFRQVLISADEGPSFQMRKFRIAAGGHMPLHTNTVEHQQYVLRGRARVSIQGETLAVEPGSVVLIPAAAPHDYHVVGDEDFEFLCLIPNAPDDEIEML